MVVLMSYHKLVERESKFVSYRWKCITIGILILAIICCFSGSWSLQKLIIAFDEHCILGADLKFKLKQNKTVINQSYAFAESSSTFNEFFGPSIENRFGPIKDNVVYPVDELNFLNNYEIDPIETRWGKTSTCDFAVFIPVFMFCFGIIITVMFIICGKGGKAEQSSFLPQPWRIVTPSIIFFIVMTCLSIANLTTINDGLNSFCKGFLEQTPDVGCLVSMNNFNIRNDTVVLPSILYIINNTFSWILLVCWVILFGIMISRILFVIDFQLVRVTIKTLEEYGGEGMTYEVVEPPQEDDKHGNNAIKEC